MAFFAFLFVVVPLTEFLILSRVSESLGFANTVALVLATGLVGGWLAKLEGLRVLTQWQGALSQGRMPEEGVVGGVLLFVGAILLITPGVMTDVFGLLMLIPLTRKAFAERIVGPWLESKIAQGSVRVGTVGQVDLGGIDPFHDPFQRQQREQRRQIHARTNVIEADYEVERVDE